MKKLEMEYEKWNYGFRLFKNLYNVNLIINLMVSQNKKFQYTIISLEFTKMDGENQNSSD